MTDRNIESIIVHCSATQHSDVDKDREWIRQIHVEQNGWSDIGYHFIILRDGTIQKGRPMTRAGAHARGHNKNSIGVCLMGGLDDSGRVTEGLHHFSHPQQQSLAWLIDSLRIAWGTITNVWGHRDLSPDLDHDGIITPDEWVKACPTFEVADYMAVYLDHLLARNEFEGYEPTLVQ